MKLHHHPDPFAEIASREHPASGTTLAEIPPPCHETIYFSPGAEAADRPGTIGYEEELARFRVQLEELRARYAPFLRDLTPVSGIRRNRRDIDQFQFRYRMPEDRDFRRVLAGEGDWERVSIPDFRGPTDERGRWTGYYRTVFAFAPSDPDLRVYLAFEGVDYKATVYLNGQCLGSHEGFFAPFDFDVTDLLREQNTLVVEVRNDYPMMGVAGTALDGDKMYAATGPGWDDPYSGWHHCPPGAGIYNSVYLEERPKLFVRDIFVRPNIDEGFAEVWVDAVNATDGLIEDAELTVNLLPKNFEGAAAASFACEVPYAGPGMNYFRYRIDIPSFRLWEPDTPWLYTARVRLKHGSQTDERDRHFGMRKFHMDEEGKPKGSLYLNNRPIVLRGANEMGHLQQCVMRRDYAQLIDDILIAKLANMNFYRITQRPVQEEIYDYFDMLGMMHQCDLPAFGFIRRNQFCEAVRQSAEMERLIRSHPSSVVVSLINEPSRTEKRKKGHRHLHRDELEAFFTAARAAIYVENPDRVVKNTDGDYNPPTREGLPDFHCYNMWYTDNTLSVGKMLKGYLPPVKAGWKAGCGEYGAEGLDNPDLMISRYPKEWLPQDPLGPWMPDRIVKAQTYPLHGDWYPEQETLADWVAASQRHQSLATRWMTDAWRRRADYIVSTAIHLLIDAWPSGWMKALVGADRIPKPAYFTYRSCLEPVRVHLRTDRWRAYGGERLEVEAWLLNDTPETLDDCRIVATLRDDERDYAHYSLMRCAVSPASSRYAGTIPLDVPRTAERRRLYVDACLVDRTGTVVNRERLELDAFPELPKPRAEAAYAGDAARRLCERLGLRARPLGSDAGEGGDGPVVVSSGETFAAFRPAILERARQGAPVLLVRGAGERDEWDFVRSSVATVKLKTRYFAAVKAGVPGLQWMKQDDLSYFYNEDLDRVDGVVDCHLEGEDLETIAFAYQYSRSRGEKLKLPVVAARRFGKSALYFVALPLDGRIGCNPALDRLLVSLMTRDREGRES
ncbi:sugar-binding domain-containing protein [Paenibacillus cisolokensis]|uniref:glycoside hydrolase family 2 protein n=1 Tax=Paenibacillus cisolokensis TaxID=1658519 RepID=UPI003D28E9CE